MQVQAAYQVSAALVFLFGTIATWRILLRWRSMNSQGKTLWMQSWSWSRIVGLMAVLLLVTMLVPVPNYESTILPEVEPSLLAILLNLFAKLSSLIVLPIIWFWWCDQPPRQSRTLMYVVMVWMSICVAPWQNRQFIQLDISTHASVLAQSEPAPGLIIWSERFEGHDGTWALRRGMTTFDMSVGQWLTSVAIALFLVGLSTGVYVIVKRVGNSADKSIP